MDGRKTVARRTDDGRGRRRSLWKRPAAVTAVILLIPLLGNHFVDGWNWELRGFVLAGTLLFCTALTFELATRDVDAVAYRAAVGVAFATAFLLVWMNVVQVADDVNPGAATYFAVPIVGIVGGVVARFQPVGMARALFATALAQGLALSIALISRTPRVASWTSGVARGFVLNAVFALLFLGSAFLFRTAARGAAKEP